MEDSKTKREMNPELITDGTLQISFLFNEAAAVVLAKVGVIMSSIISCLCLT